MVGLNAAWQCSVELLTHGEQLNSLLTDTTYNEEKWSKLCLRDSDKINVQGQEGNGGSPSRQRGNRSQCALSGALSRLSPYMKH